jgi:hypothetical protein
MLRVEGYHMRERLRLASLVTMAVCAMAPVATAYTFSDEFDGPTLDARSWIVKTYNGAGSVDIVNGWARVATRHGDFTVAADSGAGIFYRNPLADGDYTAEIAFRQQDYEVGHHGGNQTFQVRVDAQDASSLWYMLYQGSDSLVLWTYWNQPGNFNYSMSGWRFRAGTVFAKVVKEGSKHSFFGSQDAGAEKTWHLVHSMTLSQPHPYIGLCDSYMNGYTEFDYFRLSGPGEAASSGQRRRPDQARLPAGPAKRRPRIVTHPEDTSVQEGEVAAFTVTAEGGGRLTYEWYRNGARVEGADGASLEFKAARADKGARFHCVVANAKGRVESRTAVLDVVLKGPSAEKIASWDGRLVAKLKEASKDDRRPALNPKSRRKRREILSIDPDNVLGVRMSRNLEVGLPWEKLTLEDKANLALSVLHEDNESDHCVAAFYLLAAGRDDDAKPHLAAGGEEAERLRAAMRPGAAEAAAEATGPAPRK